jgi:heme oxygenase
VKEKLKHAARFHAGLFIAEALCISAFVVEISRALSGNTLSWAYVVEWPILGAYAIYMWRKLLKDDQPGAPAQPSRPDDDRRLEEWNDYLASVHAKDHPRSQRDDRD